ncbi:MAG: YCF48-related protein, partial [Ignavibacteria bacterium]|nr:YCF48-related protein [Ignavibacteria bacterium]
MKKFLYLMLVVLILPVFSYSQDYQGWKFMHPLPQSNLLRKIRAIDANNWVSVGANGTFMRTTSAGANWYFHHFASKKDAVLKTSQNYDLWFFNANTGIVAGDQGYIGRTTNGGVTFDSVGIGLVPTNSRCWALWFADANTGYIGAGSQSAFTSQILKTTNGGVNWTLVYSSSAGYVVSIGGADAQTVVASWFNGTSIRTTNGGSNWTETTGALMQGPYNITFLNTNTGFAAGGYGKVSRTTNAGVSWDSVNTPTADWSLFQIKPVTASEIYAVGDPGFIYKSTNLGTNWTSLPISVPNVIPYIWYSIEKAGSNLIMSGDYGLIAKSSDGGITWSSNNSQYNTQIMNDIHSLPGTSKIWFAGRPNPSGHQIMYSSNHGNNWITYGTGGAEEFFAITMLNQNTGYVSANNSKVFKTSNGGQNWVMMTQPSGSNYSMYSMDFVDENTGWVCANYSTIATGNVFKTTNGGNNWTQYNLATTNPGSIMSCDFVDANTGFVSLNSSNKPVYKTTDGGVTWTPYTTGLTGITYEVKAVNSNIIYAVTSSGTNRVAKSTNGGVNWTGIAVPFAGDFRGIDFKDANTGYINGNSTTII